MFNNYNLCHIRTINWDEIITGHNAKYTYVYNFTSPERECPACHANCTAGCWGEVSTPAVHLRYTCGTPAVHLT